MMMLVSTMWRSLSTGSGNLRSGQRSTPVPSPSSGSHGLQPANEDIQDNGQFSAKRSFNE